jgi:hypothetical protein
VHCFRATFATWAEECTDYPDGVREAALAHKYKSETTAAYQRGAKLEKRRALMDDWADFISTPSNVVQLARARSYTCVGPTEAIRENEASTQTEKRQTTGA